MGINDLISSIKSNEFEDKEECLLKKSFLVPFKKKFKQ